MSGTRRLPGGEPRKASQRNSRRAVTSLNAVPIWRASMPVFWKGRTGIFRRDVGDGEHGEIVIDGAVYPVRIEELRSARRPSRASLVGRKHGTAVERAEDQPL